jgi:putative PIN family toxin of toxin-antitoxin system
LRVILDTNIVLRAAFRRNIDSNNLLARARRGEFETAVSTATLAELSTTLSRQRLQPLLDWDEHEQALFLDDYAQTSIQIEPVHKLDVVRDPRDNQFIELAVEAEGSYIVTSDKDLLDLVQYESVLMVTEAQFLAILREASDRL